MRLIVTLTLLFLSFHLYAADSLKVCMASRVSSAPKIDGVVDDEAWRTATPIRDFVMNRPTEGAQPTQKSEVRVVYDDRAVYVAAILYDTHPDSILHELGNRDDANLNA